ncbi:hypothetical protein OCU04_011406 [Sclerotinia nivalis]|uniref:Uncharacterized protein n=1 Tax=Sclerotinia nivalis TaxID=352851 RepID=A0A9X0AF73_9HELO|nr:hypothetical protein OCU04_011406 [Sclerotinia nivalis]
MSSLLTTLFRRSHSTYQPHTHSSSTSTSTPSKMGSCLSLSSGPSPKNSMFTSTAFGRSAYVQIEKQEVKKSLLIHEEDYYSDEEDVGFMDVPTRRYTLNKGKLEMGWDGEMGVGSPSHDLLLNKTLPPLPEEGDEPPFEGMVKVWSSEGEGRWMWPRGVGVPVVVSDDYRKWREQRDERIGGLKC